MRLYPPPPGCEPPPGWGVGVQVSVYRGTSPIRKTPTPSDHRLGTGPPCPARRTGRPVTRSASTEITGMPGGLGSLGSSTEITCSARSLDCRQTVSPVARQPISGAQTLYFGFRLWPVSLFLAPRLSIVGDHRCRSFSHQDQSPLPVASPSLGWGVGVQVSVYRGTSLIKNASP